MKRKLMRKKIHIITLFTYMLSVLIMPVSILLSSPAVYAEADCSEEAREARADFYSKNDIQFVDPCEGGACSSSGSVGGSAPTSLTGADNYEKVWNYFTGRGLSAVVTAGMMGNLEKESHGMYPWALEAAPSHAGQGFGIIQWTAGRRTAVEAALRAGGITPADYTDANMDKGLLFQLNYLWDEMEQSYGGWEQFSSETSVGDMAYLDTVSSSGQFHKGSLGDMVGKGSLLHIHAKFVISGDTTGNGRIQQRMQYGLDFFEKFAGSAGAGCSSAANGDFQKAVQGYVLPKYAGKGVTGKSKAMPEYVAAADERVNVKKKYIGNGGNPWYADCGGFTTTLISNTIDPTYNTDANNGYGGPTGDQRQWLEKHWTLVGKGDAIDAADLLPGDIFIREGHTFVFIGDVPGIESNIASASNMERVPMAGRENITDGSGWWYRKP